MASQAGKDGTLVLNEAYSNYDALAAAGSATANAEEYGALEGKRGMYERTSVAPRNAKGRAGRPAAGKAADGGEAGALESYEVMEIRAPRKSTRESALAGPRRLPSSSCPARSREAQPAAWVPGRCLAWSRARWGLRPGPTALRSAAGVLV